MQRRPVLVAVLTTALCVVRNLSSVAGGSSEPDQPGVNTASSPHFIQKSDRIEAIKRYILQSLNVSDNRRFNRSMPAPRATTTDDRDRSGGVHDGHRSPASTRSFASLAEALTFYAEESSKSGPGPGVEPVQQRSPGKDPAQRHRRRLHRRGDDSGGTEPRKRGAARRRPSLKRRHRKQVRLNVTADRGLNSSGNDDIQFTLKKAGDKRHRRRHLEVTMATVKVRLGPRMTSHSRRSLALNGPGGRHRLGIVVYAARESNQVRGGARSSSSVSSTGGNTSTPLAVLQLTESGSRRRLATWQRLLLPTTYVQDALDSGDGVVRLRIVCDGCNAFGRRLLVEPATPTASVVDVDGGDGPYLEVVARRSRRRRRRHRHRLCPAPADDAAGTGRLAAIMRRRC